MQLNYKYKLNIHNNNSSYCNYNYIKISTLLGDLLFKEEKKKKNNSNNTDKQ